MNKSILIGRLVKDIELRYTSTNNVAVCNFTLAVDRRFKQGEVDFINLVAWDKTAEFISKYFSKGRKISIVGRIENSSWDAEDGTKRYKTEVIAEEAYFCDSKKDSMDIKDEVGEEFGEMGSEPNFDEDLPF